MSAGSRGEPFYAFKAFRQILETPVRAASYDLKVRGWGWAGKAVCKGYLLDYDWTFALLCERHLDERNAVLRLPVSSMVYVSVTPVG